MYDSITVSNIWQGNITINEAKNIFDQLLKEHYIRNDIDNIHRLSIYYNQINSIDLREYSLYKDDVISILNLFFSYRIAFEKMFEKSTCEEEQLDIPLMAQPHKQLIFDLIEKNIIKPINVIFHHNYENALKSIYFDKNLEIYRDQLEDKLKSIADILEQSRCKLELSRSWNLRTVLDLFGKNDNCCVQEIHLFSINGLRNLIDLQQNWTWKIPYYSRRISMAKYVITEAIESFSKQTLKILTHNNNWTYDSLKDEISKKTNFNGNYYLIQSIRSVLDKVYVMCLRAYNLRVEKFLFTKSVSRSNPSNNNQSFQILLHKTFNEIRDGFKNQQSNPLMYNKIEKYLKIN